MQNLNYKIVCSLIDEASSVLDLGCGEGNLLELLRKTKAVKGLGIEIDETSVLSALQKGLSVVQKDLDKGLTEFQNKSYDWAILNQTLQSVNNPELVMEHMLRVAKKAVVSFPNFGYWRVRFYLFFKGKMPKYKKLPYEWYNTPNVHLLTISDFYEFCKKRDIKIEKSIFLKKHRVSTSFLIRNIANFFSQEAIFVISKNM